MLNIDGLWDTYYKEITQYVYRRTSDPHLAEDLAAETLCKAIAATQNGRGPRHSESGWLYRIARNLVIDYYRARDRQHSVSIDDAPALCLTIEAPVKQVELALDKEVVQQAMQRLTNDQAYVIALRYFEGCDFEEIATTMDKTVGAVKALQHRGIATLRCLLYERLSA